MGELSESFSAGYFYDSVLLLFAGEAVRAPWAELLLPLKAAGRQAVILMPIPSHSMGEEEVEQPPGSLTAGCPLKPRV